jgi:hypothetical protein
VILTARFAVLNVECQHVPREPAWSRTKAKVMKRLAVLAVFLDGIWSEPGDNTNVWRRGLNHVTGIHLKRLAPGENSGHLVRSRKVQSKLLF